jgi:general secretion pathway protein H
MKSEDGYTLTEIIVVMAIFALVTSVGLPYLPGRQNKVDASSVVSIFESHLRDARAKSIVTQKPIALTLSTVEPRVFKQDQKIILENIPVEIEIETRFGRNLSEEKGIAVYKFYPNGTATGGSIKVSDAETSEELEINWLTAIVERRRATE